MKNSKNDISFDKWDIVLVTFPMPGQMKKRPALIISPASYNQNNDIVIVNITSNLSVNKLYGDYMIWEWQKAKLPKPSMIRMNFATVNRRRLEPFGKLNEKDVEEFGKNLKHFFNLD